MTERRAQLLAAMPEGVGHESEERLLRERRERRLRPRPEGDDRGIHPGRGAKRARRHAPHDARLGEGLDEHREVAPLARVAWCGGDPPRDLLLDENNDERWAARIGKKSLEERRGDLVRKVGDDAREPWCRETEQVDLQGIRLHDSHVLVFGQRLFEQRDHPRIDLDGGHRTHPRGECGGQNARSRTDLENLIVR